MKLKWVGLLAVIPLIQPGPVEAATPLRAYMIAPGSCQKLMLLKQDFTQFCSPRLANELYANGRTGFTFTLQKGAVVTFSGIAPQVKLGPDAAIQPVDLVIWKLAPEAPPISDAAVGRCKFSNPYKGRATVSCTATSKEGDYTGQFETDGSAPDERRF